MAQRDERRQHRSLHPPRLLWRALLLIAIAAPSCRCLRHSSSHSHALQFPRGRSPSSARARILPPWASDGHRGDARHNEAWTGEGRGANLVLQAKRPGGRGGVGPLGGFWSRIRRIPAGLRRRRGGSQFGRTPVGRSREFEFPPLTLQRSLVYVNVAFFLWQIASAAAYAPTLNACLARGGYGSISAAEVAKRNLLGSPPIVISAGTGGGSRFAATRMVASSNGPFTTDFWHQRMLTRRQPHRLVTSGFLHGGIVHLLLNMRYLWMMPHWLGRGLGWSLYLTAYLASIVGGNLFHSHFSGNVPTLGASGGICGLNGLAFVMYRKMGRNAPSNAILKSMIYLFLYGMYDPRISNAGHLGGFAAGAAVGYLFGPNFRKSYVAKRNRWYFVDDSRPELRARMGPNIVETGPNLPLSVLWMGLLAWCIYDPVLRSMPRAVARGVLHPGSLGGLVPMG